MNWLRVIMYVLTRLAAAWCLVRAGIAWAKHDVFMFEFGIIGALLCWILWKWFQEYE